MRAIAFTVAVFLGLLAVAAGVTVKTVRLKLDAVRENTTISNDCDRILFTHPSSSDPIWYWTVNQGHVSRDLCVTKENCRDWKSPEPCVLNEDITLIQHDYIGGEQVPATVDVTLRGCEADSLLPNCQAILYGTPVQCDSFVIASGTKTISLVNGARGSQCVTVERGNCKGSFCYDFVVQIETTNVPCPSLTNPTNGKVTCDLTGSNTAFPGDTCSYSCDLGYDMVGTEDTECISPPAASNSYWTNSPPQCVRNEEIPRQSDYAFCDRADGAGSSCTNVKVTSAPSERKAFLYWSSTGSCSV